jgi:hypothetical protein
MPGLKIPDSMSLVRGGPVHRLQGRLGLLADDGLPTMRCGLLVVALAWLPLAGLAMLDGRNFDFELGSGFYTDLSAYARFVLAAFVLIVTDRVTDNRLNRLLAGFGHSGIVGPETHSRFFAVLAKADDRSGSSRAELVMLLAAFVVAALSTVRFFRCVNSVSAERNAARHRPRYRPRPAGSALDPRGRRPAHPRPRCLRRPAG